MPARAAPEGRAWWQDPVGDSLVGAGFVGLGFGIAFVLSAQAADQDKGKAMSYPDYLRLADRATTNGEIGVIGLAVQDSVMKSHVMTLLKGMQMAGAK